MGFCLFLFCCEAEAAERLEDIKYMPIAKGEICLARVSSIPVCSVKLLPLLMRKSGFTGFALISA